MIATPTYRPCPACASDAIADLARYARDQWRIGLCTMCDLVFLRNPVAYTALEEEFAWEKTYVAAGEAASKPRGPVKRLAFLLRRLSYRIRGQNAHRFRRLLGAGKVIDIGCGGHMLLGLPFEPYGIELSKTLAARSDQKMRAHGGYCIQGAGAEAIWDFEPGCYDGVLMHSYLEHEVDFDRVLRGSHQALRPGGRIFIRVPNFSSLNRRLSGANWPGFRFPDHVNYFTPATLRTVIKAAGFQFKLVNRHKIWLDDNIQALAIKPA